MPKWYGFWMHGKGFQQVCKAILRVIFWIHARWVIRDQLFPNFVWRISVKAGQNNGTLRKF